MPKQRKQDLGPVEEVVERSDKGEAKHTGRENRKGGQREAAAQAKAELQCWIW